MSIRQICGALNALLLFSVLLTSTLFLTEYGLEGSIWTTLGVALCAVFFVLNIHRLRFSRMLKYGWPIPFIALSVFVNASTLPASSLRSATATGIVFALFWLAPVYLNQKLLKWLVLGYVIVGAVLSVRAFAQSDLAVVENGNFNVNPNGAAAYFYVCGALSILFLRSRLKWILVALFGLLMVTTSARTGCAVYVWSLAVYYLLSNPRRLQALRENLWTVRSSRIGFRRVMVRALLLMPISLITWYLVTTVAPQSSAMLTERLNATFGPTGIINNRDVLWDRGIELSLESPITMLFGHGPATISMLIGRGSSSSYVEALGSYGYPFMVASILVTVVWMWLLVRDERREILLVGPGLLLWGITETSIFSGVSLLWFLFIFVAHYLQSRDSTAPGRRVPGPRPVRRNISRSNQSSRRDAVAALSQASVGRSARSEDREHGRRAASLGQRRPFFFRFRSAFARPSRADRCCHSVGRRLAVATSTRPDVSGDRSVAGVFPDMSSSSGTAGQLFSSLVADNRSFYCVL